MSSAVTSGCKKRRQFKGEARAGVDPDPVVPTDCAELWAELEQARAERERMRHRTDVMCRRRPRSAPVRASMFDTPPSTPTSRVITGFAHCHERGACPASPTPRTNAATPPSTPTNCHERGACPASPTPRTNTAHWSPHAHSPTTPENWPCGHYSHSPPLPWPSVPAWPHAAETIQPTVGSLPSVVTTPCHPTPPGHSQYLLGRWQFLPHTSPHWDHAEPPQVWPTLPVGSPQMWKAKAADAHGSDEWYKNRRHTIEATWTKVQKSQRRQAQRLAQEQRGEGRRCREQRNDTTKRAGALRCKSRTTASYWVLAHRLEAFTSIYVPRCKPRQHLVLAIC